MVIATATHDWYLVGPWYGWQGSRVLGDENPLSGGRAEDGGVERSSRPILQKYATSRFLTSFLGDPQKSLQFTDRDLKHSVRKLFLPTHERFYLVVCELHCDEARFPAVTREKVCSAGFVIRRRTAFVPFEARPEIEKHLRKKSKARARLMRLELAGKPKGLAGSILSKTRGWMKTKEKLAASVSTSSAALSELYERFEIRNQVEGWYAGAHEGFGEWRALSDGEETPEEVEEQFLPLYPLIPDPTNSAHTSPRGTMWFGVVPTISSETCAPSEATSAVPLPRFDDRHRYEIRCFVRGWKEVENEGEIERCCKGRVTWSAPTEPYFIAPHFDLHGTSNRLTLVQLPDFGELADAARSLGRGEGAGIGFITPTGSSLSYARDAANMPTTPASTGGQFEICFFSIPLITIIAMFVLQIFLPIVVFMFGLWWMLLLKFCIPPSITLSGDLNAEFDVTPPSVAVDASLRAELRTQLGDKDYNKSLPEEALSDLAAGATDLELAQLAYRQGWDFRESLPQEWQAELAPLPASHTMTAPFPSATRELAFYPTVYRENYLEVPRG